MDPLLSALWPAAYRLASGREWPPDDDAGVDALFNLANVQGLLPLLMVSEDLPPDVAAGKSRFRALAILYRRRHEIAREATRSVLEIIGPDTGILIKGGDYRYRLYPSPDLRPMNDLDILVPRQQFAAVIEKLRAAGMPSRHSRHGDQWSPTFYEAQFEVGPMRLEIQRSLGARIRAAIDYDGLFARRESFEADSMRACRLSAADAISLHAVNMAKDEFASELIKFLDFALLLSNYAGDLPEAIERAYDWQTRRALYGALLLTTLLIPASASEDVIAAMEELLPRRTRRFLCRVLPDPRVERSGHTRGRVTQLWRKYWLTDRVWRRFAFLGYHAIESAMGTLAERRANAASAP